MCFSGGLSGGFFKFEKLGYFCTPSINVDGTIRAGEADTCFKIGHVSDDVVDVLKNISGMKCNKCGLVENLSPEHRVILGE
jgi:hypothetical protein